MLDLFSFPLQFNLLGGFFVCQDLGLSILYLFLPHFGKGKEIVFLFFSLILEKEKKLCFCVFLDRTKRCGSAVEIHCCGGPLRDLAIWTIEIVRLSLMLFMKKEGKCTNSRSLRRRAPALCLSVSSRSVYWITRAWLSQRLCLQVARITRLVVVTIFYHRWRGVLFVFLTGSKLDGLFSLSTWTGVTIFFSSSQLFFSVGVFAVAVLLALLLLLLLPPW